RESAGYVDLAEGIERNGAPGFIGKDLEELFRRLLFNVLAGHRDDHLRNHGFLRTRDGWRLAPAFDLNPLPEKATHELAIGLESHRPDIEVALAEVAPFCRMKPAAARRVLDDVSIAVRSWRSVAAANEIEQDEIELMDEVFAA
ncbi:MAG: HipA domain-containing protein, partial [Chloroflexi bacterium]|nr:HipA domain-containing protein [Chloroflexota bacterium]